MTGAIIAAGQGHRLKAAGVAVPKPLVRVLGKTLLDRVVDNMQACGLLDITCITNEEFAPKLGRDPRIRLVVQSTPSSMESLFALAPLLGQEPFVLSTVDAVFKPAQLRDLMTVARGDGTLAVTGDSGGETPLALRMAADGRVTAIGPDAGASGEITAGFYVLSPRIFQELEEARRRRLSGLRYFLGLLLGKGYALFGHRVGPTVDVDTPREIRLAEEFLIS